MLNTWNMNILKHPHPSSQPLLMQLFRQFKLYMQICDLHTWYTVKNDERFSTSFQIFSDDLSMFCLERSIVSWHILLLNKYSLNLQPLTIYLSNKSRGGSRNSSRGGVLGRNSSRGGGGRVQVRRNVYILTSKKKHRGGGVNPLPPPWIRHWNLTKLR